MLKENMKEVKHEKENMKNIGKKLKGSGTEEKFVILTTADG